MHNSPILTLKGVSKPLSKFLFSIHDMVKVLIGPQKCTPGRIIQTVASFGEDGVLQRFCRALSVHWSDSSHREERFCYLQRIGVCYCVEEVIRRRHSANSTLSCCREMMKIANPRWILMELPNRRKTVNIFKCKFPRIFTYEISAVGKFETLMLRVKK